MVKNQPIFVFFMTLSLLLLLGIMAPAAQAGDPETGQIQIPLRWCGMKGSPTVEDPGSIGESDLDFALWHRHERATDQVWTPGANITLRSAFTEQVRDRANFPIIDDPKVGPGLEGDIVLSDPDEIKDAVAACEAAWDDLVMELLALGVIDEPLVGPIAINFRQFVDSAGNALTTRGRGGYSVILNQANGTRLCNDLSILASASGWFVVSDYFFTRSFDPDDTLVAHEAGHVLGLEHGNGLDDDGDGVFDGDCDPDEDEAAEPWSLMTPGRLDVEVITEDQKNRSRAFAKVHSGAQIDPPAMLINGDTISDHRVDTVHEVTDDAVDIVRLSMTEHTPSTTTIFTHQLFGVIPLKVNNQYVVFADLDNNPATGGTPASLGFPTTFQGAELVTRVVVSFRDDDVAPRTVTPSVWRFESGDFTEVSDPDILAQVFTSREGETNVPWYDTVSILLPNSVRGPASEQLRFQAISEQLEFGTQLDRVPNEAVAVGWPLVMVPPTFPVCAATPSPVQAGAVTTVEISGLIPNRPAKVLLGEQLVATGATNNAGNASISFEIPSDSREGPRLVTVGNEGTALTADCTVEVAGTAVPQFEYAAKLVCGLQEEPENMRLVRGFYATAINIRNPNDLEVKFRKQLALTFPPEEQRPGQMLDIAEDELAPGEALEVDCEDIVREVFPNGFPTPYIKGFVVIQSPHSLDVIAVYTAASLDDEGQVTYHNSIDVEQIHERIKKASPPLPPLRLDHFKCYSTEESGSPDIHVLLTDQFGTTEAQVLEAVRFCNPVEKIRFDAAGTGLVTAIQNKDHHLMFYHIETAAPSQPHVVQVSNQFGQEQTLEVTSPLFLAVPTQKLSPQEHPSPEGLDHFMCYRTNGDPLEVLMDLEDQFHSERQVKLGDPFVLCNPVEKTLDNIVTPIQHTNDHLMCYQIEGTPFETEVGTLNQFGDAGFVVTGADLLCVPSRKMILE